MSCFSRIFAAEKQWSTIRAIAPEWFERIAAYEERFGCTIQRHRSVRAMADRGVPFPAALAQPELVRRALARTWDAPVLVVPASWQLPAGAFGDSAGPF